MSKYHEKPYQAYDEQGKASFKKLKITKQVFSCIHSVTKIWIRSVHVCTILAAVAPTLRISCLYHQSSNHLRPLQMTYSKNCCLVYFIMKKKTE